MLLKKILTYKSQMSQSGVLRLSLDPCFCCFSPNTPGFRLGQNRDLSETP